ncbi:MAG: hypothetical protein WB820_18110 [Rhodoplanes sp.]
MLSEIKTSGSATVFVGTDAVDETCPLLAAPSDALRLPRKGSSSEGDSFFYIAMRISRHKVRVHRSDRRPVIV